MAVCTKLSALLFLPAACGAVLLYRWWCDRPYWQPLRLFASWPSALAALGAFLVTVWAIYGCTADPFYGIATLARGVAELAAFADTGEPSFFLGHINLHGSPAFFPVLILVKSPLPFLAAVAIGAAVLLRRASPGLAAHGAAGRRRRDRRERHSVDDQYRAAAYPAGLSAARDRCRDRAGADACTTAALGAAPRVAGLLLLWQIGEAAAVAPDYLTYFNQLAAGEPQRIVTGSDLDWGQDVKRLAAALKQRHVDRVSLAVHTSADLRRHDDLPPFEDALSRRDGRPAGSRSASR